MMNMEILTFEVILKKEEVGITDRELLHMRLQIDFYEYFANNVQAIPLYFWQKLFFHSKKDVVAIPGRFE